jgi:hypothetical protein
MKKICLAGFAALFCASVAFGDEVDKGLTNIATEQLRASARQMIRVGINSDDAIKMTRVMLENRFRQENTLRAHEIMIRAKEEGLPVEPIMNKAQEGIAKRVKEEHIIQAMERVRSRYAFAYEKAREVTQDKAQVQRIGNHIAECMAAGMSDYHIYRIMHQLKYRSQEMISTQRTELAAETFRAVREMVRFNVSSLLATEVACEALKHHYSSEEMARMRKAFISHSRNTSPRIVAENYSGAIQRGQNVKTLDFSGGLGVGKVGGAAGAAGSAGGPVGTGGDDARGVRDGSHGGKR